MGSRRARSSTASCWATLRVRDSAGSRVDLARLLQVTPNPRKVAKASLRGIRRQVMDRRGMVYLRWRKKGGERGGLKAQRHGGDGGKALFGVRRSPSKASPCERGEQEVVQG